MAKLIIKNPGVKTTNVPLPKENVPFLISGGPQMGILVGGRLQQFSADRRHLPNLNDPAANRAFDASVFDIRATGFTGNLETFGQADLQRQFGRFGSTNLAAVREAIGRGPVETGDFTIGQSEDQFVRAGQPTAPGTIRTASVTRQPGESPEDLTRRIQAQTPTTGQSVNLEGQFERIIKISKDDPAVFGILPGGQRVAFENIDQLRQVGGEERIEIVPGFNPAGAIPFSQFQGPSDRQEAAVTSDAARRETDAERIDRIKKELGLDDAPILPDIFGDADQASLDLAREERDTVQLEMETILAERLKLEEEFRQFEQIAGRGVTEEARTGIVSEQGRQVQNQLDALNRRELVLEIKLRNRNGIISEMMGLQRQEYTDAVNQYNKQFSQALQLYKILGDEQDELKQNALANLDVFSKMFQAQIGVGQLTADQITPTQRAKIEELELQAGLPLGSTIISLSTLKPDEEVLIKKLDKNGNYVEVVRQADGNLITRGLEEVTAPTGSDVGDDGLDSTTVSGVRSWLLENKRNNPDVAWFDLWGQLADKLQEEGLNPTNFDKQFWEILHPDGLAGFKREQKRIKDEGSGGTGDLSDEEFLRRLQELSTGGK